MEEGCKPGPATVLSKDEERQLASYIVAMGFGLSRDDIRFTAYKMVENHTLNGWGDLGLMVS